MGNPISSDIRSRYLRTILRLTERMDVRIVLQMQRIIEPALEEIYVPLSLRESNPRRRLGSDQIERHLSREKTEVDGSLRDVVNPAEELRTFTPEMGRVLPFAEVVATEPRLVILGDPGAGKTTLTKWLTHQLARSALEPTAAPGLPTGLSGLLPIPVTLRFFAAEKPTSDAAAASSLDAFLAKDCWLRDFPGDEAAIGSFLRGIVAEGRCVCIFDGLDEAIATDRRRFVTAAIEDFSRQHPAARIIVTSRVLGYEQAALSSEFSVWRTESFSVSQARQFVQQWALVMERAEEMTEVPADDPYLVHRARERAGILLRPLQLEEGDGRIDEPVAGLPRVEQSVRSLMGNPLFCTLIGLIQQQGQELPRDRAELYRLCVEAFIYDWEIRKRTLQTDVRILDKHETLDVLEELAFQLHEGGGANVMSGTDIVVAVQKFLQEAKGYAPEAAAQRADALVNLINQRAGLLVEKGEGIFGFGHLQFQEYLAGRALVREPREVGQLLEARLLRQRWQEPIVLAASHLAGFNERQGGEFIRAILNQPATGYLEEWEPLLRHRLILACRAAADSRRVHFQIQRELDALCSEVFAEKRRHYLWMPLGSAQRHFSDPAALQPLLTILNDKEPLFRYAAAEALGQIRDPTALPPLLALLNDKEHFVRSTAAQALGQFRDPAAIPALLSLLNDKKSDVRSAATRALGQFDDPAAIPTLLTLLKDKEPDVRFAAARALAQFRNPAAFPTLLTLIKDKEPGVRSAAAYALAQFPDPAAFPPLLDLLKDKEPAVSYVVARALGQFRHPAAISTLLTLLKHKAGGVRSAAAVALGQFRDPAAFPPLLTLVQDKKPHVRFAAAQALGQFRDPAALPPLLTLLNDKEPLVRSAAARALGQFRDSTALPPLLTLLSDKEPDVRSAAAEAFGQFRDPAALPPLIALLNDKEPEVRSAAAVALGQFRNPAAIPPLLTLLNDKELRVRYDAARALGQLEVSPNVRSELLDFVCGLLRDEQSALILDLAYRIAQAHLLT